MKYLNILLILLLSASLGWAEEARFLTMEECVQVGLKNSESLHSALMKIEAAQAEINEKNASRLPLLKFNGAYTRLSDERDFSIDLDLPPQFSMPEIQLMDEVLNSYQFGLTLQQPIFTGFRLTNAVHMAEYNARAKNQNYETQRNELVYLIKSAYWNLYKSIEFKKVVDENITQIEAHLKDIKNMFDQGMVTKNEVLKVEVQLSNIQFMQIESETAINQAMMYLNSIMGLPLEGKIDLKSDISEPIEEVGKKDSLVKTAFENRPEIKAIQFQLKTAESGVKVTQSSYYPQIYLQGNYNYDRPNQRIMPIKDKFEDSWDISVALSYDVWNWRKNHHQVRQAKAQVSQIEDGLKQIKDGVELEVNQTYLNLIKAEKQIAVAEQGIKQAEENYRVTNERFKAGMALSSDLLDAEVALLQAKTSKTTALINYELEKAKLEKAMGKTN